MFSNLKKNVQCSILKRKVLCIEWIHLFWLCLLYRVTLPSDLIFFFFFFCKCIKGADIRVTVFSQYSLDLKLISHLSFSCVSLCWFVCVLVYMHFSICVYACVCMYVHMPIWFSCAHSTGQKTESTATDPSRWSLSPLIWKRTSSAEYSGSTMRLGYGNTKWTSYKQKKHSVWSAWCVVVGFFLFVFFCFAAHLFVTFETCLSSLLWSQFILWLHTSHIPLIRRPVRSSCAEAESLCSLTMPLHQLTGWRCDCHKLIVS